MNDRYKKYFDNISPEKKLTEDTLAKMYRELEVVSEPKKFNFRIWVALAACTAAAVSAVLFSPDIRNTGNSNSENFPAAENPSVTENTTACAAECTGSDTHTVVFTESGQVITGEYTCSLVSSVTSSVTSSVQDSAAVTEGPLSSGVGVTDTHKTSSGPVLTSGVKITATEKLDVTEKITVTEKVTEATTIEGLMTIAPAPATSPYYGEPEGTHACTTANNPGEELSPEATTRPSPDDQPLDTMVSTVRPGSIPDGDPAETKDAEAVEPPNKVPAEPDSMYTEYIYGYEININYADYFCEVPATNMEPVELSKAEEVLGAGIIPEDALSMSSDIYGYAEAEDSSFDYGFFMSIGTTGIPDTEQDDYILFSVSPSDYYTAGFTPVYYDSHYTYINGKEYCFGISDEFPGIYFCTFNKNNLRYRISVRGYSLYDLVYIVSNM